VDKELQGKAALVTGASRGIGAASAVALARQGVTRFTLQYHLNSQGAEETLAALRREGADGDAIQADFGDIAGVRAFLEAIRGREFDILVNNAGSLVKRAKLPEFTEELFDRVMNLNLKSAWMVAHAVAPAMVARGSGVIVNVSSIAGRHGGGPGATIYSAAKAAVTAMTKGIAKELAPLGVRVNAVSPGTVDNYFHEQFSTREVLEGVVKATPAGRLGTNEELADVIVFLCGNAARFIYGQTIEVNGGMLMV
jgi:3-oxoacyl-[acyl-carrier protein] reductase